MLAVITPARRWSAAKQQNPLREVQSLGVCLAASEHDFAGPQLADERILSALMWERFRYDAAGSGSTLQDHCQPDRSASCCSWAQAWEMRFANLEALRGIDAIAPAAAAVPAD